MTLAKTVKASAVTEKRNRALQMTRKPYVEDSRLKRESKRSDGRLPTDGSRPL
jgi:hypothetical protein